MRLTLLKPGRFSGLEIALWQTSHTYTCYVCFWHFGVCGGRGVVNTHRTSPTRNPSASVSWVLVFQACVTRLASCTLVCGFHSHLHSLAWILWAIYELILIFVTNPFSYLCTSEDACVHTQWAAAIFITANQISRKRIWPLLVSMQDLGWSGGFLLVSRLYLLFCSQLRPVFCPSLWLRRTTCYPYWKRFLLLLGCLLLDFRARAEGAAQNRACVSP